MTTMEKMGLIYLAVVNLTAFLMYGIDKWKAKRGVWRIRERTLILTAVLGGGVGALLGMKVWHHKTRKALFVVGVPLCLVAWVVGIVVFRFYL